MSTFPAVDGIIIEEDSVGHKAYNLILGLMIVGPFIAVGFAIYQLWNWYVRPVDVIVLVVSYFLIVSSVTIGLHRYFTHFSFQAKSEVVVVLAILAYMSIEGQIAKWVADHIWHHIHSDEEEVDLHSPWRLKMRSLGGFFFAHIGWFFVGRKADQARYAKGLLKKHPWIAFLDRFFPVFIVLSFAIPTMIGGVWEYYWGENGFWWGAFLGFVWGSVRVGMVHHATWSVNSLGHTFGNRPYVTTEHDKSTNVPAWGIPLAWLTMGELHHCTHHAFQWSALHGTAWWNDLSFGVLLLLKKCGRVSKLRLPTEEELAAKRVPVVA